MLNNLNSLMIGTNEAIDKFALNKSLLRIDNVLDQTINHTLTANTTLSTIPYAKTNAYGMFKFSNRVITLPSEYSAAEQTLLTPSLVHQYLNGLYSTNYNVPALSANCLTYTSASATSTFLSNKDPLLYAEVYSGQISLLNGGNIAYGYKILSSLVDIWDTSSFLSGYLSGQYTINIPSSAFTRVPLIYTQLIDNVNGQDSLGNTLTPADRLDKYYISNITTSSFIFNLLYACDKFGQEGGGMLLYPGFTLTWMAIGV